MEMSAKFVGYVLASYAVTFVLLAVLIGGIVWRMHAVRRKLTMLEAQGAHRRKAPVRPAASAEMVEREAS